MRKKQDSQFSLDKGTFQHFSTFIFFSKFTVADGKSSEP